MKPSVQILLTVLLFATINSQLSTVFAQGTAFTYQGRLNNNGAPANGSYDFSFALINSGTGGLLLAGPVTNAAVTVINGLFTTLVDFGNVFTGGSNWLEIAVSTNGANSFTTLSPRQQLTPTPYAIMAENVSGLTIQNNSDDAPNVIGGSAGNYVVNGVEGATVAGGGVANYLGSGIAYANSVTANFGTVSGGVDNTASGVNATVGGGVANTASDVAGTVGGGNGNTASGQFATVAGGSGNVANQYGTVGGGVGNTSGQYGTVGGGQNNTASGQFATVGGGANNSASGNYSFAAGRIARAVNQGAFVWADSQAAYFSSTANDQFLIRAQGGVGIGTTNPAAALDVNGSGNFAGSVTLGGTLNLAALPVTINSGGNSLLSADGNGNFFAGIGACNLTTPGSENTANGAYTLHNNTTGYDNTATGADALDFNSVGHNNTANGFQALFDNSFGNNNIALGSRAGDNLTTGSYNIDIGSEGIMGESGIIRIGTQGNQTATYLVGTVYVNNIALTSDRNVKENFTTINAQEVLAKVAALPVTEWNYKTDNKDVQHLGPMAQDFKAAFNLDGADDKHISVVDEGGVALAAIQGLNQKLEQKQTEITELKQVNDSLQKQLDDLKQIVQSLVKKN